MKLAQLQTAVGKEFLARLIPGVAVYANYFPDILY